MNFSLNKKATLLIVCMAILISALALLIYYEGIRDIIERQYEERSIEISRLAAVEIDTGRLANVRDAVLEIYAQADDRVWSDQWGTPEFEAYVSRYEPVYDMEDYRALLSDLRRMQDVLNVDCLYITWLDVENECYLYLVDAAYEEPCPVGCIDPIYTEDRSLLRDPEIGFVPYITNTPEYGWIIATGMPIHDAQGEIVGYSAVDISMNDIMASQNRFLIYVVLSFLIVSVLVCSLGIYLVNRAIVEPVNRLSEAAAQYTRNRRVFSELDISRGDEIGMLAQSMKHMEEDINGYISSLEKTTNDLISAREHARQMDRAANIDALTKVRNKRAYDIEAERLGRSAEPYGVIMVDMNGLKDINDTHGHEKGDISIKTVCRIVCQVFKHSPVYRVGGDEFIVILEHSDLAERDRLIRSIEDIFRQNARDASLPPWERVTAAVGCAVFDPGKDDGAESVLQRADTAMYENKHTWKDAR